MQLSIASDLLTILLGNHLGGTEILITKLFCKDYNIGGGSGGGGGGW